MIDSIGELAFLIVGWLAIGLVQVYGYDAIFRDAQKRLGGGNRRRR